VKLRNTKAQIQTLPHTIGSSGASVTLSPVIEKQLRAS